MKVAMFPRSPLFRDNPYLNLLENGLNIFGVEFIDGVDDEMNWHWLLVNRGRVDILHFHWLQYHYDRKNFVTSCWALTRYITKLYLARKLGYRLIWTVHNLDPHEFRYPLLDSLCRTITGNLSHRIIVHSEDTKRKIEIQFNRYGDIYVIPHLNYVGAYPGLIDKEEAKRRLRLTGADLVFLCFGTVRSYKGFEDAIKNFKKLPGERYRLIIAGRPMNEEIEYEIKNLVSDDPRIVAILQYIPNEDVPIYFSAADVVLLPFRKITTSGSAVLAMSFGRPVVGPALGSLLELVSEDTGILYEQSDPDALLQAMRSCIQLDLSKMGQRAYQKVTPFTPREVAARHFMVYSS